MSGCNFFFLPCQNCSVLPVEQPCVVSHFLPGQPCGSALTDKPTGSTVGVLLCRPRLLSSSSMTLAASGAKQACNRWPVSRKCRYFKVEHTRERNTHLGKKTTKKKPTYVLSALKTTLLLWMSTFQHLPLRCSTDDVRDVQVKRPTTPGVHRQTAKPLHKHAFPPWHFPLRSAATLFSFSLRLLLLKGAVYLLVPSNSLDVDDGDRPTVASQIPTAGPDAWSLEDRWSALHLLFIPAEGETGDAGKEGVSYGRHACDCLCLGVDGDRKKKNKTSSQPATLKALTCDHQQLA